MKNQFILLRRPFLVAATLTIAFGLLITATQLRKSTKASSLPSGRQVIVKSLVPGFQVVEFRQVEKKIRLVLKNNYTKSITAYALTASKPDALLTHRVDSIFAGRAEDRGFLPGAMTVFEGEIYGPAEQHNLTIRSVVFDDVTSEGDQKYVQQILDKRRGRKMLAQEILPKLQKMRRLAESPDFLRNTASFAVEISETRNFASSLSRFNPRNVSDDIVFGYRSGADAFLEDLEEINKDLYSRDSKRIRVRVARTEEKFRDLQDRL